MLTIHVVLGAAVPKSGRPPTPLTPTVSSSIHIKTLQTRSTACLLVQQKNNQPSRQFFDPRNTISLSFRSGKGVTKWRKKVVLHPARTRNREVQNARDGLHALPYVVHEGTWVSVDRGRGKGWTSSWLPWLPTRIFPFPVTAELAHYLQRYAFATVETQQWEQHILDTGCAVSRNALSSQPRTRMAAHSTPGP